VLHLLVGGGGGYLDAEVLNDALQLAIPVSASTDMVATAFRLPVPLLAVRLLESRYGGRRIALLLAMFVQEFFTMALVAPPMSDHRWLLFTFFILRQVTTCIMSTVSLAYTTEIFTQRERSLAIPLLSASWIMLRNVLLLNPIKYPLRVGVVLFFMKETRLWPTQSMPARFRRHDAVARQLPKVSPMTA
jgi:MFS family permease